MITRVPPGTWETLSFPSSKAAGDTAHPLQIDPRLRVRGRGDEQRTQRWYRQAKETKRGEMGGRESQHLIVPLKRGNQPEGPRQGKGVPSHEPLKRKTWQVHRDLNHVHVTTTDRAGREFMR
jgi:hypothetical protein